MSDQFGVRLDDHSRRIGLLETRLDQTHRGLEESDRRMLNAVQQYVANANEKLVARLDMQDKQSARVEGIVTGGFATLKILGAVLTFLFAAVVAVCAVLALRKQ